MPQPVHPAALMVLRSRYAKTVTKRKRAALTKEARHTAPRAARSSGASSARDQGRQLQQMNERLREDAECEQQQHRQPSPDRSEERSAGKESVGTCRTRWWR